MAKILVTSALPYANGPIHFGHVTGAYLPADVFVRFQRAQGHEVLFICGSDEHGTPVTVNAAKAKQDPSEFTAHWHRVIHETFQRFKIEFDNFSRTSYPHHHELAQQFFRQIEANGYLFEKSSEQLYCGSCEMFLPDRYLVGTCPSCKEDGARGDECPRCGHWVEAGTLIEPRCKTCDSAPVEKATKHWFLDLAKLQPKLEEWIETKRSFWKPNVLAQIDSWLKQGLRERPITRDLDWGIPVPAEGGEGKVLYVWFDAPIGYISSTQEWAQKQGTPDAWRDWWEDPETQLFHFIGKDNIVFHCLTWPAMVMAQDEPFVLPENVPANEFLNLEGRPFSTSDEWIIPLESFFERYSSDMARYVLLRGLPETADSEWQWSDFQAKVNSELNDTLGNLAQRILKFLKTRFDGEVPGLDPAGLDGLDKDTLETLEAWPKKIAAHLTGGKVELKKAILEYMELARVGNRYFNEKQPWKTFKTDLEDCRKTMALGVRILAGLAAMGSPFLPDTARSLWAQLGFEAGALEGLAWDQAGQVEFSPGHTIGAFEPLFRKISDEEVEAEVQSLEARMKAMEAETEAANPEYEPLTEESHFEDFLKVDLRVGKILEAEEMKKSKKLLKLSIDLGFEKRQILAGIKEFFQPEELIGRKVVVHANLAPRKMMGIESQGMVLAANDAVTGEPTLLDPGQESTVGSRVS